MSGGDGGGVGALKGFYMMVMTGPISGMITRGGDDCAVVLLRDQMALSNCLHAGKRRLLGCVHKQGCCVRGLLCRLACTPLSCSSDVEGHMEGPVCKFLTGSLCGWGWSKT